MPYAVATTMPTMPTIDFVLRLTTGYNDASDFKWNSLLQTQQYRPKILYAPRIA